MKYIKLLSIVLFSFFAINGASSQTVTVTNPNGGNVLYVCQTYTITWTQTGSPSNYWNIDYSANGGSTWSSIASNLLVTNGQFAWTVPNIQTTNALVRVTDAQNNATTDVSDTYFTVNIPITVTAPNGGESWTALTNHNITWNVHGTSNTYNLYYSIDGGITWLTIATNYASATGIYAWTVPNNPSVQCQVRVMDYVTNCMVDNSDNNFIIVAATPILLTPNGGETVQVTCNYNITWNTATFFSAVKLEYSTNNGGSWNVITSSTSNTGSYTWSVPNAVSINCLIRASNTSDLTIYDVSNAVFTIAPPVLITAPNGGETLTGCANYNITWTKSNCVATYWNIYYSLNNGTSWVSIASAVSDNGTTSQTYAWYVPNNLSTTLGLIRVESYYNPGTYYDLSNAPFTIAPSNNIQVTAPNGGENVLGCASLAITWTKLVSPCNTSYNLYYSIDNGVTYTLITSVTDNGTNFQSYSWTVPNGVTTSQALIQVQSGNWTNINDVSNGTFTINPSNDITVTAPNGGESWQGLSQHTISWSNLAGASGLYTIQYSTNGGASYTTLATNYTGNSYIWASVPNTPSTTCLVKVSDYLNPCKFDVSNANFSITAATPVLTAPNGGENYNIACTTNYITWNTTTLYSTVNLYYSINNGSTYTAIATGISNTGSYQWTIPDFPSAQCLVKITNSADVTSFDVSNAVFTIAAPITVTAPNGGENWIGCTSYNIAWSKSTCIGGYWNIYYSINNGTSWTSIVTAISDNGLASQSYNWQVPNGITSSQVMVKVESYYYPTSYTDQSDAAATISSSNDITVTAPNGGQTLASQSTYNITWTNTAAVSGAYTIQFSSNNGSTWNTVASNIIGNTYIWTVPNTSSNQCLIRVYDYNNTCRVDQSDAPFTVTPSGAVLTSPNGGEVLEIGCTFSITWVASTFISNVQLDYSTNNGSTWVSITTNTSNTGSYSWVVPNTVSANCLVRASNVSNLSLFAVSAAVFTIAPAVTVTSPNGGEILSGCSTVNITWTKSPCTSVATYWNIYYSIDNGTTWVQIIYALANSGTTTQSYAWTVPNNLSSTTAFIRIESYNYPTTYFDLSNAVFTINPYQNITVTSPNGGETATGCSPFNITWTKSTSPCNTNFYIYYSLDNGNTYTYITTVADNGLASQTYAWSVPNTLSSTQALIKVISYNWANIYDVSNAVFTINPSADVTLTSPNGGETWQGLSSHTITWTNLPGASGLYSLQYSTDNGTTWTSIVTNIPGNSYPWTVPNAPSTTCLIKVIDYLTPCKFDVSNATFTISPATPIVLTPNGGQSFNVGCTTSITWNTTTFYSAVNLYYSVDNGATYTAIATSQTNNGAYTWTIPNFPSTNCLVKVANAANVAVYDVSDVVFTILTPVTVTSPNGNESWHGCSTYNITWTKSTCVATYWNINYSTDNGVTWNSIYNALADNGSATQTYAWTIPNTITTTQALVQVVSYYSTSYADVSNSVFTISPSNDITVTAPNGGQVIAALSNYTITWTNLPTASGQYTLQYSTNNGTSWTTIVSNITGNSYNWTVPTGASTTCLVRVYDYVNSCKIDQSDAVFTITPPQPILLTPNGGESLQIACTYNITWNANTFYSPVKLDYSTNAGATWLPIISSTTNNGTYAWTVPNTVSANILVKASNTADLTLYDVSDNILAIPAAVAITSPNGGENLVGCSNYNIIWNKSNCIGNWNIYYSLNNGSTFTTIASNVANNGLVTQTYAWYVPDNLTTTQGLIRVESASYPSTYYDLSNADFTITPNQNITVTAPNGSETWAGCNTYNITWTKSASPCNTSFNIYYSLDNGVTYTAIVYGVTDNGNASQTYAWTLPNNLNSTQAKIKVESANYTNINDASNNAFTLLPSRDVTVTSPNGGQTIQGLTAYTITWTNSIYASGLYNVYYSTDNGTTWNTITTNYSGNSYNWNVPNVASATCLIRVMDYLANCRVDQSDAVFTIIPATPILLTPNGGEVIYTGYTFNITWNTSTLYSTVNLYYSLDNGTTWTTIATNLTNNGAYTWTIPNANSTTCLVRIANYADITVKDQSDAVFTINPAVLIITPNGGESLGGCTVTSITFNHSLAYNLFTIQYSINGGTSWITITSNYSSTTSPATYTWTLPNTGSTQTLVKVYPNTVPAYFDNSNGVFTIVKPVTIIQPNFGGILLEGSTYNITWSSDGISNVYDIFYSTNGGASFTNIVTAYNTSTNQYTWTVPNTPSTNCKIWVRDNTASCKNDTSDVAFTISATAAPITLLTPNGGQTLTGCQSYAITWTDSPVIGTYDIAYSINGGSTFINIVTSYVTSSGSYTWIVPNGLSSTNALIRVRSTSVPATFDLSDAAFTINTGSITATNDTTICSGVPLQLNASGGVNYTWTPSTGLSSTSIANPVATLSSSVSYTVTSNNGGCAYSKTINVTVVSGTPAASVAISASPSNTICTSTTVIFTATPTNGGYNPSYQWKINGGNVGTNSPTYTSSSLTNSQVVTCVLTSSYACVSGSPATSNAITMNVSNIVTPSVSIGASPSNTICAGVPVTFTATPTNGGSSPGYQWKLNGSPVGTNSATYTNTTLSNGDIVSVVMTTNALCYTSLNATSSSITMTVNTVPTAPLSINGNTSICSNSSNTYSINAVVGATSNTWTIPGGWSGSSTSTSIATVANTSGGYITVTANNTCGSSTTQSISVNVNLVPTQPLAITGNTTICSGTANTYQVPAVSGASTYTWTMPGGWTGSSATNSLTATSSTTSGNISVAANNSCGSSSSQFLAITVNTIPSQPGSVSGNATICAGTTNTYTISAVGNATSYTWTLPSGWSGASSTTSITAQANTTSGNISVVANNTCGASTARTFSVTVTNPPTQPGTISGSTTVCANAVATYNITAVNGATSYNWISPQGWTGSSTSNSITDTAGVSGGTILVSAVNSCGISSAQSLTVNVNSITAQPGAISGNNVVCNNTSNTYSITGVSGATSYTWTLPGGWTGTSTNTSITSVSSTISGNITVVANNSCGASVAQTYAVTVNTVPPQPGFISGSNPVCYNSTNMYSINPIGTATSYTWTLPSGWSGTSASSSINATANTTGGNINVIAVNSCGNSTARTFTVTVTNPPAQPGAVSGLTTICAANTTTYSVTAVGGATSYTWTLPGGWSGISITNSIIATAGNSGGVIAVTANNNCGSSTAQNLTITVNPSPNVIAAGDAAICSGTSTPISASGATTYSWLPTTGLTSASIANPNASPATTTTYTVTGTASGCPNTAIVTITVNQTPSISVSGTNAICTGGSSSLTASGGTTYTWLPVTGLSDATIATPVASPSATTTYTVTGTTNSCSNTSVYTITVNTIPVTMASGSTTICSGTSSPLSASGATTYSWLPSASLNNAFIANPTATPALTTTYTVTGTTSGCSSTATVTLTTTPSPIANAGNDASYCTGGSTQLNAAGGGTYSWSPATGLSATNISNPVASPSATTTYTVTVSNGTCSATDAVIVNVNTIPVANAGSNNAIVCGGSTTLNASGGATYSWSPTTGLSNPAIAAPSASPTSTTTYTVTVSNGNCSSTANVVITVNTLTSSAGSNVTICSGNSTTLAGSTNGTVATYAWLPSTGLNSTSIANPVASPTTTTTYTLTVTQGSCTSTSSVTVTVNPALNVNAGMPATICSGTSTNLGASGANTYTWLPATGLSATNIANPIASPATTTTYTVTGSNGNCTATSTVLITVNASPVANAGSNVSIACGGSTTLSGSGGTTYSWSPSTGLSATNIASPICTPPYTTTYTLTVSNGTCSSTAALTVTTGNLVANAGNDVTICTGNSTTLNGTVTGGGSSWVNIHTSYLFSQAVGTYTPLSGGTVLYDVATTMDELTSAVTIPAFVFNNITYTSIYISTNGFVSFGTTAPSVYPATNYNIPISGTDLFAGCIAGFGADIDAATAGTPQISYQQVGNEFVVQFQDESRYAAGDQFSFQIRLNTSTNQIKIVYSAVTTLSASAVFPEIGLRGPDNTFATNVNNRSAISTTGAWVNSTAGTTNASTFYFSNAAPATIPAAGTTFIWTPQTAATTYSWAPSTGLSSTTILNPVATPTTTTTYTLTAVSGSCTAVDMVMVTVGGSIANAGSDVSICSGSSTNLSASGASTYTWSPATGLSATNIANPIASPTTTTTYTVTGTTGTCTSTDAVIVTVVSQPIANAGSDVTICSGNSTTLGASGGTIYSWSPATGLSNANIANPIANPTTTTSYTVTASNGSCSSTDAMILTVNPAPIANAGADVGICSGASTNLSATGGSTYSWLPATGLSASNISNPVASPSSTTTYTVTASNGTCSSTDAVIVTVTPAPVANAGSDASICSGNSTTLSGSGGTSYSWSPATGLNNAAIANPTANPTTTTTYTLTAANGSCTSTDAVIVTVNPSPTANAGNDVSICSGTNTTLNASGGITYTWLPATGLNFTNVANPVASPSSTTTYTVTVTSGGCSATEAVIVTVNTTPVANAGSDVTICSGTGTNLNAGGGTTYLWSPATGLSDATIANPIANPSSTTSYTVTATSLGCSSTDVVIVNVVSSPVANAGNDVTVCSGYTTTLNASGGLIYSWLPATGLSNATIYNPIASPSSTTTYTVTASNGTCSSTDAVIVTVNPSPVANAGNDVSICTGGNTTLNAFGGTSYSWSPTTGLSNPGISNPIATPASTTTYVVTVSNGTCSSLDAVVVTVLSPPVANAGSDVTICSGNSTTLNASGGTSYSWSPNIGLNNPNIANPVANPGFTVTYTVNVSNGACSSTDAVIVNVNPTPVANAGNDVIICLGNNTTLNGSGGTTYLWSPSAGLSATNIPNPIASPTVNTTYILTVSTGSCSSSDSVNITVNIANAGNDVTICAGSSTTLNAVGGTSYSWSPVTGLSNPNIGNPIASPTSTTTYTVTTSSSCGTTTDAVIVTVAPLPVANAGRDTTICAGTPVTLNASGGTGYSWLPVTGLSNPSIANPSANPTGTTTYTVTVSNALCSATDMVVVNVTALPIANAGSDVAICSGNNTTLNASGGTNYAWLPASGLSSTSIFNPVANPTVTTTYTVTASNGNCSSTDMVVITVNNVPAMPSAITGATSVCDGSANSYSVTNDAGATSYTWTLPANWTGSSTTNSISANSITTTGIVTVVANNNCGASSQSVLTVVVNPLPTVTLGALGTVCLYGSPIVLSSGSPAGGIYSGTGISGTTFTPLTAGLGTFTITYTYTTANSCTDSAAAPIVVDICTAVAASAADNDIVVYPNPFTDFTKLTIGSGIELDNASFIVYDVLGNKVFEKLNITDHQLIIERNSMNSGVYFYRFSNQDKLITTGKLVIAE